MAVETPACLPPSVQPPAIRPGVGRKRGRKRVGKVFPNRMLERTCPQTPAFGIRGGGRVPQYCRMRASVALTPRELVDHFGGLARGRELTAFGFTRRHLADAVNHDEIMRIRPGVFATLAAPREVRLAAGHGGALTCAGALRHHGVWVLRDDTVPHVWMGPANRVHHDRCQCVVHFRPGRMKLGYAEVEHALVHALECHGEEFFFCALESALNQRLVRTDALARIRAALPRSAQWMVDFARSDADSGLESLVRLRLHLLGIDVQTQVSLPSVGRVDFVIEGRLILEIDGRENHAGYDKMHEDRMRDAAASALGYETLRFDYWQVIENWPVVVSAIRAALIRARG